MFENHLLVAMPDLDETWFSRTVILVCEHNPNGAIGLVINRPFDFQLSYVLDELGLVAPEKSIAEQSVLFGGPLQQERGFIIHEPYKGMEPALELNDKLLVSTKTAVLRELATGKGPDVCLVALGFCGWEASQLEDEVKQNLWLPLEAVTDVVYHEPFENRWATAGQRLGVDMTLMAGHSDTPN